MRTAAAIHYYIVSLIILAHNSPNHGMVGLSELLNVPLRRERTGTKENWLEAYAYEYRPGGKFIRDEDYQQDMIRRLVASRAMTGWPVQRAVTDLKQIKVKQKDLEKTARKDTFEYRGVKTPYCPHI